MTAWSRVGLIAFAVAFVPIAAAGQPIPPSEQPGRQNERFIEQPTPLSRPVAGRIALPNAGAPKGAGTIQLQVRDIRIAGATVYSAAELSDLSKDLIGKTVPLSAIYGLAQRITAKYGQDGYVLSRAILPPQALDPKGAVVRIDIVEGYVDQVVWPDGLRPRHDFFSSYSVKITAERPANIHTIERYLLLAGDLPGLSVSSRFEASKVNPTASTLIVSAGEKPIAISGRIDNRGTEARGPNEFLTSATFNNSLGLNEALTISYAGAWDTAELQYVSANYRQVLTPDGLSVLADASYSWGRPGTAALELLEFESNSFDFDFGLAYPFIRSRDRNLTVSGFFFLQNNEGDILAAPNSVDRLRGVRLKVDLDMADQLSGINQLNAVFSQGIDGLDSTDNDNPLASRANGRVDFTKLEARLSRVQPLMAGWSLRLAAAGQWAFTPLLASEECGYGGRDIGRAFDPSEITGDRCWSTSAELRYDLKSLPNPFFTSTQLYAYVDHGAVYRIAPSVGTASMDQGSSAGVGIRLGWKEAWALDLSADKPLDGRADQDWRFFFKLDARH